MKAALLQEFGKPLVIADRRDPEPVPGQILIRVEACGLCHSDLHLARGDWEGFKARMPIPAILGHEVAGRVAQLGVGSTRFREGDRVGVPWFHWTCGACSYCESDLEVFCDRSEITGVTVDGGFAEYLAAWESHVIPIPETLTQERAAPLFCAGATVWSALRKLDLDNSFHLGVWGVGGLGQYAIQLGKLAGARISAVDILPARLEMAGELGADVAVAAASEGDWFAVPEHRVDAALVCATGKRLRECIQVSAEEWRPARRRAPVEASFLDSRRPRSLRNPDYSVPGCQPERDSRTSRDRRTRENPFTGGALSAG